MGDSTEKVARPSRFCVLTGFVDRSGEAAGHDNRSQLPEVGNGTSNEVTLRPLPLSAIWRSPRCHILTNHRIVPESQADKENFVRTSVLRLQQRQMLLHSKLDRVCEDRLSDAISNEHGPRNHASCGKN